MAQAQGEIVTFEGDEVVEDGEVEAGADHLLDDRGVVEARREDQQPPVARQLLVRAHLRRRHRQEFEECWVRGSAC